MYKYVMCITLYIFFNWIQIAEFSFLTILSNFVLNGFNSGPKCEKGAVSFFLSSPPKKWTNFVKRFRYFFANCAIHIFRSKISHLEQHSIHMANKTWKCEKVFFWRIFCQIWKEPLNRIGRWILRSFSWKSKSEIPTMILLGLNFTYV